MDAGAIVWSKATAKSVRYLLSCLFHLPKHSRVPLSSSRRTSTECPRFLAAQTLVQALSHRDSARVVISDEIRSLEKDVFSFQVWLATISVSSSVLGQTAARLATCDSDDAWAAKQVRIS